MNKTVSALAAITAAAWNVFAEADLVDNITTQRTYASGAVISPSTTAIPATLPDVGVTPRFHLDATQTTGWTFNGGTSQVRGIPSLTGTRFLTNNAPTHITGQVKRNDDGSYWDNNDYWASDFATLEQNALNGKPALDFGARDSKRGFLFDWQGDHEAGSTGYTNQLRNIGTVIAVWNSENGGGQLLAGGRFMSNGSECSIPWVRGPAYTYCGTNVNTQTPDTGSGYINSFEAWSPVVWSASINNAGNAQAAYQAVTGVVRHDGQASVPWKVGFNGGWEIVSMMPTVADCAANGIGFGTLYSNISSLSGGFKVAELLIYPACLDVFAVKRVEDYLANKWFGRIPAGQGGNAYLHDAYAPVASATRNGTALHVEAGEGETLTLGDVSFDRGSGAVLYKSGPGTLVFNGSARYTGTIVLSNGTLKIAARTIPGSLPANPAFAIDASVRSTYEGYLRKENGTTYVDRVNMTSALPYKWAESMYLGRDSSWNAPFLAENAFDSVNGSPSAAFDFWDVAGIGGSFYGAYWRTMKTSNGAAVQIHGITTMFAVVNPRFRGGTILGNVGAADVTSDNSTGCYFERCQQHPSVNETSNLTLWSKPLLGTNVFTRIHPTLTPVNGITMIDGVVRDPRAGYATPGWQVVCLQVPASIVSMIGATYNETYAGGFQLAELALYNRMLSEEDIRDAEAYLTKKWFNRSLPGYERTASEAETPQVQCLTVENGAEIEIPSGKTARIGTLTVNGAFTVKGGGTLEVVTPSTTTPAVTFKDGSTLVRAQPPTVSSLTDCAKGASMHLDAMATNTVIMNPSSGTYVRYWADKTYRNYSYDPNGFTTTTPGTTVPPLVQDGAAWGFAEGTRLFSFGDFRNQRRMCFMNDVNGMRSAYIVRYTSGGASATGYKGGMLLGIKYESASNFCDFLFRTDSNGWCNGPFRLETKSVTTLSGTTVYTNGTQLSVLGSYLYDKSPQLIEVHLPAGAHVSGLSCYGSHIDYTGGSAYGEMLLYERALTDREKVATRNYLMKKWFGTADDALTPLPEATVNPGMAFEVVVKDGDEIGSIAVWKLSGEGDITKIGDGTLDLSDFLSYTGKLTVAAGTVKLNRGIPAQEPLLPARDALITRFDATKGVTTAAGSVSVTRWDEAEGTNGWYAVPNNDNNKPTCVNDDTLSGNKVVKFGKNSGQALRFKNANDAYADLTGFYSVLWVIGSQEGGGFLLGGGTCLRNSNIKDSYHRGVSTVSGVNDTYGDNATDALLYIGAADASRTAEFYVNDTRIYVGTTDPVTPMNTGLSGGWDIVTMRQNSWTYTEGGAAGGFAWCTNVSDRSGSQRLAEVVFYNKRLTDEEREAGVFYLRTKWGINGSYQMSRTNALEIALAFGTSLDLNGADHYLASLEGVGSVVNGGTLSAGNLVLDCSQEGLITVDGDFEVREGMTIEIRNVSALTGTGFHPILSCNAVTGAALSTVTLAGDMSCLERYSMKVKYVNGQLGVEFVDRGLMIILK